MEERTIVINLPSRTDRRAATEKQLRKARLSAEFFPAIRPDCADRFPSIGARGCFMSHLTIMKQSIGCHRLILLEDDLNFVGDFVVRWKSVLHELNQKHWSIFYAGHGVNNGPNGLTLLNPSTELRCSHFMLFNGHAISSIASGLENMLSRPAGHPEGSPTHVDGAYNILRRNNPSLVSYAVNPPLGYQRSSKSDIADLKWFDKVGPNSVAELSETIEKHSSTSVITI